MCESSILTDGEPIRLVCLPVHHKNIGMFVTHDFKAHSPPSPCTAQTRTGSVAAGLEIILNPMFLCGFPPPGQHRKYNRDKRRFRGSIKAEMRRFFAKNIPAPRISRPGDGTSTGSLENPFADWLISNE